MKTRDSRSRRSTSQRFNYFSKNVGCLRFNEAEVVATLEALYIFASASFQATLMVESDSLNGIAWVSFLHKFPRRFQFYFNEIQSLFFVIRVKFQHIGWTTNSFMDALAK